MTYYAQGDENGNIVAFYNDAINNPIPIGCIQITNEQWMDCLQNPGKWVIENGALALAPPIPPEQLLAEAKAARAVYLSRKFATLQTAPMSVTTQAGQTESFDTSEQSCTRLLSAIDNLVPDAWLSFDNKIVSPFTLQDAQDALDSISAYLDALPSFQDLLALVVQIKNATTVEQINTIDF